MRVPPASDLQRVATDYLHRQPIVPILQPFPSLRRQDDQFGRRLETADIGAEHVGIERNAHFVERLQAMPLERLKQLLVNEQDATMELVVAFRVIECPIEVVQNREQVPQYARGRIA